MWIVAAVRFRNELPFNVRGGEGKRCEENLGKGGRLVADR
jgi:hypothetical protein